MNTINLLQYLGHKEYEIKENNIVNVGIDTLAKKDKYKINVMALGDVGRTLLMGLVLEGGDIIEEIGIWDINNSLSKRLEIEMNQIYSPNKYFPKVSVLEESQLFDCDIFMFCASKAIPDKIPEGYDIRLAQLEENKKILKIYCDKAKEVDYNNVFAIVSDPVDPLCKAAEIYGIEREKIKGFGLGVMMARARYYAIRDSRFSDFEEKGRAFGPHGKDLVIANNIHNYGNQLSLELTKLTVEANLRVRNLGFKPFIAPALSSGALNIIDYLKGHWTYNSLCLGDVYLGIKNRRWKGNIEIEYLNLHEDLLNRIKTSIDNLRIIQESL